MLRRMYYILDLRLREEPRLLHEFCVYDCRVLQSTAADMPKKDVLTKLQLAKSADKVQKHLKDLSDHDVLNANGDTLLHSYVRRKDKHKRKCLLALLVYGYCDLDKANAQGFTPLHLAAELDDVQSARYLIAFGCEVNCVNPNNSTPVDIAQELHPDGDILAFLVSVGGQTGFLIEQGFYALPTLRLEASCPFWEPNGEFIKKGCTPLHCDKLNAKLEKVKFSPTHSSKVRGSTDGYDSNSHTERQPEKYVQFESTDYDFTTPDQSITMGITSQSVTMARSKAANLTTSPPPPTLNGAVEYTDHQLSHDISHDQTDSALDIEPRSDERPYDPEATPTDTHLPLDSTSESCSRDGDEGEEEEEEEGLVEATAFTRTPLEEQSLRTLTQIKDGSIRADGYTAWQKYRSLRKQQLDSLQPLLSIKSIRHLQHSLHKTACTTSYGGEEEKERKRKPKGEGEGRRGEGEGENKVKREWVKCFEGASLVPEAFRVKPGERVLCLDGGGIRGLVQLEILRHIEDLTGRSFVDLFDWIVGTSTGGILALAMVYAEMTCAEMHKLYFEMKDRVFKNPSFGLACNTEELERILKKTFSDKRMNHRHKPKVMICAVNKTTTDLKLTFFNNCFNDHFSDELVWKVARYTSAGPIYFTECENYVDGGILANNPCNHALTRIQKYQTTNGGNLSLVVSIGCGKYPAVPLGNTDILLGSTWYKTPSKVKNILQLFFTALTGCPDIVSENCRSRCEQQQPPIQYFRFDPELPEAIDPIETDEDKLCELIIKAKQLLENYDLQMDLLIQHFYYIAAQKR